MKSLKDKLQNTLSRHRDTKFNSWKNDPKVKKLIELERGSSPEQKILIKAKNDYFDTAIRAINNQKESSSAESIAADNFKKYFDEWLKVLKSKTDFGKIKLEVGKVGKAPTSRFVGDDYKFSNSEFDFSKFINHKRGIYNDIVGISVKIILDDDEKVLKNHGYRKTINAYFDYYFYKDKEFYARLVVPDNVFPPSYKDDYEKMFKYFHDTLSIQMMKPDDDRYLYGEQDLNDK